MTDIKPTFDSPAAEREVRDAVLAAEADLIASNALELAACTEPPDADSATLCAHAMAILLGAAVKLGMAAGLTDPAGLTDRINDLWDGSQFQISNSSGGEA